MNCAHCGRTQEEHRKAVQAGEVNHKFSSDGSLEQVELEDRKPQRTEVPRGVGVSGDPILRFLLVDKGIVTAQELIAAEEKLRALGVLAQTKVYRDVGQRPSEG